MTEGIVPSASALLDSLGVSPVRLDDGEATYLLSVESDSREVRLSYDLVERSVRLKVWEAGADLIDFYLEGLEVVSLVDSGPSVSLNIRVSERGYVGILDLAILPTVSVKAQLLVS